MPVAAMDTLQIDVLSGADGAEVTESRSFVLADARDWPLSLGVVSGARLRLRLSQARLPRSELTIDRLVDVLPSGHGVDRLRVTLTGDCIGRAAELASGTSCISAEQIAGAPTEGIVADDGAPSRVGTWPRLGPVPCTSKGDPERPCVLGSFDVLGDVALAMTLPLDQAPLPLRPVVMRPFRMDRTEFTVGRLRRMLAAGFQPEASLPALTDPDWPPFAYCTFRGEEDPSVDDLPLNCVTSELAAELCAADGGQIASEAEWEHAARGRDGRPFPWGEATPECCTTSASRAPSSLDVPAECERGCVEPVGSHLEPVGSLACPTGGDVSVDGIVDLGGSLGEVTRDKFGTISECFPSGLLSDPVCVLERHSFVGKGADWTAEFKATRASYRYMTHGEDSFVGFRCTYPEEAL